MSIPVGRSSVNSSFRARLSRCAALTLLTTLGVASAHAVVVRGIVTDALGKPVQGARVQLIEAGQVVAVVYADDKGAYEIRSSDSGRFTLLSSAPTYLPAVGIDFYGGSTDVVERQVVLAANTVRQDVSVTATGFPTPLPQLTAPVSVIPGDAFSTRLDLIGEIRQTPGAFLVQSGQGGSVTSLFMRGGPSDGNKVLIDGIPAEDIGGSFDYGTVSSTGVGALELYRGPNSALYGTDSQASVVSLSTPRGVSLRPQLDYSGDAGNLHSWRNEVQLAGTHKRFDYLGAFSRYDTSNALANDRYHLTTTAANLGYDINANTHLRATLRNGDAVQGLPGGYDFYGIAQHGRQGDQDLYSGFTLDHHTHADWQNLVRYGIARKREQAQSFGNDGTLLPSGYFGNIVTIHGANGFTATDRAAIYGTAKRDQSSLRDELYYQSDYVFPHRVAVLFSFRTDDERGSSNIPSFGIAQSTDRRNYEYSLQVQGDIKSRFFYSLGGAVQKNHLYGIAGEPRVGFAYIPVRPSSAKFHGTRIRFNYAQGVQEPSLSTEFSSLYKELQSNGDTTDIAKFKIHPIGPERSKTFDFGVDQHILGEKLTFKAGYFHNRFSDQVEYVASGDLTQYFGIVINLPPSVFFGGLLNSLTYRASGVETELAYQPISRLLFRGGYTYLDAVVEKSFSGDVTAVLGGFANQNPNIPGVNIGSSSPLIGARPFRRPPHTGYVSAVYNRTRWSVVFKGALASRADDSTFLGYADPGFLNTLLLPNRDLDFGYAKLDLAATYALPHHITAFSQVENLLNQQHIGPIGYPGLPMTVRVGLKLKLFGD